MVRTTVDQRRVLPPTPSKHRPTSDPGTIVPVSDDERSTDRTGPTGTTRLFPIIGDPITYVESPTRLTATLRERDHDGICIPRQVSAEDLGTVMAGLTAATNVDGILVTMPHKFTAVDFCATSSERAKRLKFLSVIRRNPDGLRNV